MKHDQFVEESEEYYKDYPVKKAITIPICVECDTKKIWLMSGGWICANCNKEELERRLSSKQPRRD
jgi:hypothetical protein